MPGTEIAVDPADGHANPDHLALLPLLKLHKISRSRTVGASAYDASVAVPWPGFAAQIIKHPPDVLVTIEFTPVAMLAMAASLVAGQTRRLLLVESDPAARGGSKHPVLRAMKRWAVRRADLIQTNTEAGRRYLVEQLNASPDRIRVAPYLTSRPPGPEPLPKLREGPVRLLFVNSLTERKGLPEALTAIAACPSEVRAQMCLTIIGDGPLRERCEALVAGLHLVEPIAFLGALPYCELGAHYAQADVLLIPSLADYRSLAGFEGLGYGLALLASAHDGASIETVGDHATGFIVEPRDASAFAARLCELVRDRALLLRFQQNALALYQDRFCVEQIAANLARSIEHLIHPASAVPEELHGHA